MESSKHTKLYIQRNLISRSNTHEQKKKKRKSKQSQIFSEIFNSQEQHIQAKNNKSSPNKVKFIQINLIGKNTNWRTPTSNNNKNSQNKVKFFQRFFNSQRNLIRKPINWKTPTSNNKKKSQKQVNLYRNFLTSVPR